MESYHLVLAVRYPPQNDVPLSPPTPSTRRPWVKLNNSVPGIGLLGVKTKHFLQMFINKISTQSYFQHVFDQSLIS